MNALFEKDQGFKEVIQAAQTGISSGNFYESSALNLFIALFDKGRCFDAAVQAIIELKKTNKDDLEAKLLLTALQNSKHPAAETALQKIEDANKK